MDNIDLTCDPKWVRRALSRFDSLDKDKDGIVKLSDIDLLNEKMRGQSSDEILENRRILMRKVYADIGITEAGTKREDFPKLFNSFAARERERRAKTGRILFFDLVDATFDMLDLNKDGHLDHNDLGLYFESTGIPKDSAAHFIELADKNKNGLIERNEYHDVAAAFWLYPIDDRLDNLFGSYFSGNI